MTAATRVLASRCARSTRVPAPGWLSICHSPPIAPARLSHAGEAKALSRVHIGPLVHPYAVVGDRELPVGGLIGHGDAHEVRVGVPHRVAHGLLRDAQQLVLVFRAQAGRDAAPSKVQVTPPGTVERSASWRSAISSPGRAV